MSAWAGSMQTSDGTWRVDVGGVGATKWYRLVGPDSCRNLPSLTALTVAADAAGVDLGDLREVPAAG
ncbi:hypothetical protein [Dactylosporangium sp. CA-139066]|uniref:hypothetical protein n=1 Tax=Dactylosporangium sp. CA-139066 TaxID=3239930 RepID=UPI003D8FF0FF